MLLEMRLALIGLLIAVVSCGARTPSVSEWMSETWIPLVEQIPAPEQASPARCDEALAVLREEGPQVRPAPFPELGDTADAWVRRAETILFECSAGNPERPYQDGYADLQLLQSEIEAIADG